MLDQERKSNSEQVAALAELMAKVLEAKDRLNRKDDGKGAAIQLYQMAWYSPLIGKMPILCVVKVMHMDDPYGAVYHMVASLNNGQKYQTVGWKLMV